MDVSSHMYPTLVLLVVVVVVAMFGETWAWVKARCVKATSHYFITDPLNVWDFFHIMLGTWKLFDHLLLLLLWWDIALLLHQNMSASIFLNRLFLSCFKCRNCQPFWHEDSGERRNLIDGEFQQTTRPLLSFTPVDLEKLQSLLFESAHWCSCPPFWPKLMAWVLRGGRGEKFYWRITPANNKISASLLHLYSCGLGFFCRPKLWKWLFQEGPACNQILWKWDWYWLEWLNTSAIAMCCLGGTQWPGADYVGLPNSVKETLLHMAFDPHQHISTGIITKRLWWSVIWAVSTGV